MSDSKRASWSGSLGFILAAAASAIGLGNLWRFPYLAAQYGGGIFIAVYLMLVMTFGYTLMVTEIAVGRKTCQSQINAYSLLHPGWGFLGVLGTIVPLIIVSYYCVIGGWVLRYFVAYCQCVFFGVDAFGSGAAMSADFFKQFICDDWLPFIYTVVFLFSGVGINFLGVKRGIEKSNFVLMPLLFFMMIAICVYVITLPGAIDGLKYYLIPDLESWKGVDGNFSWVLAAKTFLGAMGQMFYSLSLAMGIMVTYGSYMKKSSSINGCARRIGVCDTVVSVLSGLMIVPVVYLFAVKTNTPIHEAMGAGPGLMFITLPKVFASLGPSGAWVGLVFFALVIFAAVTSVISLFEACAAPVCDRFHLKRPVAIVATLAVVIALSTFSAFGYGQWKSLTFFGMSALDFFDFITNSVVMPVIATLTCIFIGWIVKVKVIVDEVELNSNTFRTKYFYSFMVKYFAPLLVCAILISEVCRFFGIGGWSI